MERSIINPALLFLNKYGMPKNCESLQKLLTFFRPKMAAFLGTSVRLKI